MPGFHRSSHNYLYELMGLFLVPGVSVNPPEILPCRLAAGIPDYLSVAAQIYRINTEKYNYNRKLTLWENNGMNYNFYKDQSIYPNTEQSDAL